MTLIPRAIAVDATDRLWVIIDDDDHVGAVMIPLSWGHRRVVDRSELAACELHYDPAAYTAPEPPT